MKSLILLAAFVSSLALATSPVHAQDGAHARVKVVKETTKITQPYKEKQVKDGQTSYIDKTDEIQVDVLYLVVSNWLRNGIYEVPDYHKTRMWLDAKDAQPYQPIDLPLGWSSWPTISNGYLTHGAEINSRPGPWLIGRPAK